MKNYLLPFLAIFALLAGCSEKPVPRLTVNLTNARPGDVLYAPADNMSIANSRRVVYTRNEQGAYEMDIPESDSILFVMLQFMGARGYYHSLPFFLMPGEHVRITGEMKPFYLDFDIEGSPAFEEWVRHRRETYFEYEKRLAEMEYDPSKPYTHSAETDELLRKIDSVRISYIIDNPDSELSVLYFTSGLQAPQLYEMLGEKVKNGRFKPLLDSWLEQESQKHGNK